MLTTLRIKHFTIVQELELDFKQGMTAFTGETGAGKSIMIDALLLALGNRGDPSVVRPGEDCCDITASFDFDLGSDTANWLAEHDIPCEGPELYLRRIIYAEGRSKSTINGQAFPLQKIRELSQSLVHVHGQHQHLSLLQHATHRDQLDQYAQHQELLDEVAYQYKLHQQIKQKIEGLSQQNQQRDKIQLIQFQLDELNSLNLQEGEMQALHEDHQILSHAKDYLEQSQAIKALLNSEDRNDICATLNHILHRLSHLPASQPQIKNIQELINSALIHCKEALDEIQVFAEQVQLDPERLQQIEMRMTKIYALARKNHVEASQLLAHTQALQAELDRMEASKEQMATLELELQSHLAAYHSAALKLRESRALHAKKLAQEITAYIQQLGMPKGWVEISLSPLDTIQAHGLDRVEYTVCTNPGMELDSLNKIVSGGELSRIGLAIQMITAKRGATPTLLFDEVDVGIGGATAALVGRMLRQLGERLQVFCVTHQAQVAAMAHNHYQVEKNSNAKQTISSIRELQYSHRINEIARMLGGLNISEQSLSHAQELLENSIL